MAVIATRSHLEQVLYSSDDRKSSNDAKDIVFIVGKGKRSENNKPVLMKAILQLLQEEYDIYACIDENNAGRIRVPKESIEIIKQKIELEDITPD